MPSRYTGTPIEELVPLRKLGSGRDPARSSVFFPDADGERGTAREFPLGLAEEARYEDVIQIGVSPEGSKELWEGLPAMNWVREGASPSRTADLLVHVANGKRKATKGAGDAAEGTEKKAGPGRRLEHANRMARRSTPVAVKAYAGLGKVLYLGTDSFWRWRYRARWTYHHRFWGQVLLWATMGRTTGADPNVKLMADRFAYAPEEIVVIKARILDDEKVPMSDADASLEVFDEEDELVKRVPLIHLENSGGEYRAQLKDLERGKYRVVPRIQELSDRELTAEISFEIRDLPTSEYIDLALNETQLGEFSDTYLPFEKALDIIEEVPRIETKKKNRDDTEIWDSFPYMMLVAALLGFEWHRRKKLKLV